MTTQLEVLCKIQMATYTKGYKRGRGITRQKLQLFLPLMKNHTSSLDDWHIMLLQEATINDANDGFFS